MDTLAAISLATEPPSKLPENWGLEQKRRKEDKIILPFMWRNILSQTAYQLLVLIVMLYTVPYWFGINYSFTNTDFYSGQYITPVAEEGEEIDPDVTILTESDKMRMHFTILFHTFVLMNLFN